MLATGSGGCVLFRLLVKVLPVNADGGAIDVHCTALDTILKATALHSSDPTLYP